MAAKQLNVEVAGQVVDSLERVGIYILWSSKHLGLGHSLPAP